jgi:uncharacterized protein
LGKLVFWIVVIFGLLLVLRIVNMAQARKRHDEARRRASPDAKSKPQAMVRCARCGVYLPKDEARFGPEGLVCGDPGCRKGR